MKRAAAQLAKRAFVNAAVTIAGSGCNATVPCEETASCEKPADYAADAGPKPPTPPTLRDAASGGDGQAAGDATERGDAANDGLALPRNGDDAAARGNDGDARVERAAEAASRVVDGAADRSTADAADEPLPPPCDATRLPSEDPCVIDPKYAVFVAPTGDDSYAVSSPSAPFKTLNKAIAAAQGKRVYACATAGVYDERVTLGTTLPIELYGGFDCTSARWSYGGAHVARVAPSQSGFALVVQGGERIEIEQFAFTSRDAVEPGGSSIAMFANDARDVTLRRVALVAGRGQSGAAVTTLPNYSAPQAPDGQSTATAAGAAAPTCGFSCTNGVHSTGGRGGDGTLTAPAQGGESGRPPITPATPSFASGLGGSGRTATAACSNGIDGSNAPPAAGGAGAGRWGTVSANGWTSASAGAGAVGAPGQGGGGGGGGVVASSGRGGGGGGACGGCGGAGGPAGQAGGSSFALLSYQSNVTLEGCQLAASEAGAGSKGGDGQAGQVGGIGGAQSSGGCPGAMGGQGGPGGGGGGGAGGLSLAIGFVGRAPTMSLDTVTRFAATAAAGGAPGLGGVPTASKGRDGVAMALQDLAQ